ncbi:MAG: hypothetical protein EBU01_16125 [Crocinitomicaceae bacterium]|nr:hypothetical protein [Crocinitomicaceae bacterium]
MGQTQTTTALIQEFYLLCCDGKFDDAKELFPKDAILQLHLENYKIKNIWVQIAKYGNLNFAKWFYEIAKEELTDDSYGYDNLNNLFYNSCYDGHLNFAKWLLEIDKDREINDEIKTDAFRVIINKQCNQKQLDVAKWLYHDLKVIKNVDIDWIFDSSCANGNTDVIEWILSLQKEVHISPKHICNILYDSNSKNKKLAKRLMESSQINVFDLISYQLYENGYDILANYFNLMQPELKETFAKKDFSQYLDVN